MRYDPCLIEKKWQKFWSSNKVFKSIEDSDKPKYYVLDMFPYPSGSGLHVGHLIGYTATDIVARYKRAKGFSVLHPMGWDSFGLPAEQYAVRTGTHPKITTKKNIDNFREQLSSIGFSYDWGREFATSDSDYYKWTQKFFTLLHKQKLAYMADMAVNYCPALGTVLSNEEVENGFSVEGGYPVERRMLRQWILKITAYSEKLLDGLHTLDWPESIKQLQRNWIGKSEGASVKFSLCDDENVSLEVFTTRPDTLMGVSFLAISPEHSLISKITCEKERKSVQAYLNQAAHKSDRDRINDGNAKTGVFSGKYALHPITGKKIPIWIADYILLGYGTGIVMGVPAHDERDHSFAEIYKLPIVSVISEEGICCNSNHKDFAIDGLPKDEASAYVVNYLENKELGQSKITYKLRDWLFSRQRYWGEPIPIVHFEDGSCRALDDDELPLLPPQIDDYKPESGGQGPLAKAKDWVSFKDSKTGQIGKRETHTMPQWAGSCWYFLRFCDPSNNDKAWDPIKEAYWMPVDLYIGGAEHAVLHLLYARFWHKVFFDMGMVSTEEPFKKLVNQGLVLATSYKRANGGYVDHNTVVERDGVFYSQDGDELVVRQEKMSKSKLNGVDPQLIIEEFGADAMRMYSMFSGPLDKNKLWSNSGVAGCRRFLNRLYDVIVSNKVVNEDHRDSLKLAYKLVSQVTLDIESLSLNTIPSSFMEFLNDFSKLEKYSKKALNMVVRVLSPIAPHISEELWEKLGNESGIDKAAWPEVDSSYLVEDNVKLAVQVNGKLRGCIEVQLDLRKEDLITIAKEAVGKYLEGSHIKKEIVVPNKLINFVI